MDRKTYKRIRRELKNLDQSLKKTLKAINDHDLLSLVSAGEIDALDDSLRRAHSALRNVARGAIIVIDSDLPKKTIHKGKF